MLASGPAARRPDRLCANSARRSQCSPSGRATGPLGNRATVSSSRVSTPTRPRTTRPLDAPRSTAATVTVTSPLPQERGGHAGVDGDVQAGGVGELGAAEHVDRVGDVLGEDLTLEDRALGVEGTQVLLLDAVDRGAVGAPAAGEDA